MRLVFSRVRWGARSTTVVPTEKIRRLLADVVVYLYDTVSSCGRRTCDRIWSRAGRDGETVCHGHKSDFLVYTGKRNLDVSVNSLLTLRVRDIGLNARDSLFECAARGNNFYANKNKKKYYNDKTKKEKKNIPRLLYRSNTRRTFLSADFLLFFFFCHFLLFFFFCALLVILYLAE